MEREGFIESCWDCERSFYKKDDLTLRCDSNHKSVHDGKIPEWCPLPIS